MANNPYHLDVPPKMKVKGYMYPQMEKAVGMLQIIRIFVLKHARMV
jgi:hypothetical protein